VAVGLKLRAVERELWQEFLMEHSPGSLFHRWEWQDILEAGFGVKVSRLGIFDAQGGFRGLLPLVERKLGGLKLAGSPLSGVATPHSGPLGISLAEVLPALEEYAREHRLDYVEIGCPEAGQGEVLLAAGYAVEELKTLEIHMPPDEETLWSGLEVRCRNAVRKAEKSGVEVYEPQHLEDWLDAYHELSRGVYLRQGKEPPFSKAYFAALWGKLKPAGDLVVLLARFEGKIIAGGIFPRDRQAAYYLDGVSDREYNKVVPNNLIQWEYLKRALQAGITHYDMVGANIPSIAKFKQSFGSKERAYLYAYRSRTWRARLGRWAYAKFGSQIKKLLHV